MNDESHKNANMKGKYSMIEVVFNSIEKAPQLSVKNEKLYHIIIYFILIYDLVSIDINWVIIYDDMVMNMFPSRVSTKPMCMDICRLGVV